MIIINRKSETINTLKQIAHLMAEGFQEDVLYKNLITNPIQRKKALPIFFEEYMRAYPEGEFIYSSNQIKAVAFVFRPNKKIPFHIKYVGRITGKIRLLKLLRYLTICQYYHFIRGIQTHSSAWIKRCVEEPVIHLDLIVVPSVYRGKGYAKKIILQVLDEAKKNNLKVTLETQNPENVTYYERFGFKVIDRVIDEKMTQYNMIWEESISL